MLGLECVAAGAQLPRSFCTASALQLAGWLAAPRSSASPCGNPGCTSAERAWRPQILRAASAQHAAR
jgi:hypothetical protein